MMFKTIAVLAATMTAALAQPTMTAGAGAGAGGVVANKVDMHCSCHDGTDVVAETFTCACPDVKADVPAPCEMVGMTEDEKTACYAKEDAEAKAMEGADANKVDMHCSFTTAQTSLMRPLPVHAPRHPLLKILQLLILLLNVPPSVTRLRMLMVTNFALPRRTST